MPKAPKTSTRPYSRPAPYPHAAAIAPAPTMATSGGISPSHSGNERPAPSQWDAESDEKLMDARKSGLNWGPIASNYFPGKTANACRKRHERLQEKRQAADNWSGVKIEAMAKAYMEVREQMWKILADRVGEKWQTVETKCMEKGFKNLQAVSRSASRRGAHPLSDDDYRQSFDDPRANQGANESFNDSALGHDQDPFRYTGNQNEHQRYEQAHFPPDAITPPYTSRSYSQSSSNPLNTSPTSNVVTNVPYQTVRHPSHSPYQQTLPSFGSTFAVLPPAMHRQSPH